MCDMHSSLFFYAAFYSVYRGVVDNVSALQLINPISLVRRNGSSSSSNRRFLSRCSKSSEREPCRVVVVGGGWAGFTAADTLARASSNVSVTLLDASQRGPGGLAGGWRTPKTGRPVEAGIHGFWREYRNTFAMIENIGLDLDDVLTNFTPSILVSENGRVALAPVLGNTMDKPNHLQADNLDWSNPRSLLEQIAPLLPSPLDVALLADFNPDSELSIADRISGIGLLGAWSDFIQEDRDSWERYDKISAENLFRSIASISPNLYRDLVAPLLHVLPMTPGYDCSAAAALSCFHFFALQSRGAFDVRWCRGSISERIFNPWVEKLRESGNVCIQGSARVTSIEHYGGEYTVMINNKVSVTCDAVVLAVGATAAGRLIDSCPPLQKIPNLASKWKELRGVSCVAVRLFFAELPPSLASAMSDSPVVVCGPNIGGAPQLVETGFCIYDLSRLQDDFKGGGFVGLEVDFFRADAIAKMRDGDIIKLTLDAVQTALGVESIDMELVEDSAVIRALNAVSHFCVGSASKSPPVRITNGLYICGDWVDRSGHASWSTEKAVVTGLQVANAIDRDFGLDCRQAVIPAAADTPQLMGLRKAAKAWRNASPPRSFPVSPWLPLKQFRRRIE